MPFFVSRLLRAQQSVVGLEMPAQHAGRPGMHMGSKELSIPMQSHVTGKGVAAYLEGSEGVPDLELESLSSAACSGADKPGALAAIMRSEDLQPTPYVQQYFVGHCSQPSSTSEGSESKGPDSPPSAQRCASTSDASYNRPVLSSNLDVLLKLPELLLGQPRRSQKMQPLVDYSKSILLTSSHYIETMELKAQQKEEATHEAACRKEVATQKRLLHDVEQRRKEEDKLRKAEEARAREAFQQRWTKEAIRESSEHL